MSLVQKIPCDSPIVGIQSLTAIDFPGKIAGVFFTRGCPWKCRYCQNPSLSESDLKSSLSRNDIEEFLRSRKEFLDGIVISGGEPTIHSSLCDLLAWVRDYGYSTAIHTNGGFPEMLRCILKKRLVDYIAMDIKAPPAAYDRVTQVHNTGIAVSRSIKIILSSNIDYEFRTTYHPDILSEKELIDTMRAISCAGAKRYFLQRFRTKGVMDQELVQGGDVVTIPQAAINEAQMLFEEFEVR
ncbi:MAG: anaerobic ribonucleoside-triphosphate reductase activating protein [Candidatus Latescibacteria bacterium]|jgi:pyruvate formate lyase activating enzyme|nr:anaerobic ribonucleoside-triphosphate reductase activating protein [Candidatus Latescibacterota bacterium]